jgi:hypothetical protein
MILRKIAIHTGSIESLGIQLSNLLPGNPASFAWTTASNAIFVPFTLNLPVTVTRLFTLNGATVSGNIDMGVYTQDGARMSSFGATTQQANINGPQFVTPTAFTIGAGRYYFGISIPNTAGTLFRTSVTVVRLQEMGVCNMAAAHPLPATATFATATATYLPWIGIEGVPGGLS